MLLVLMITNGSVADLICCQHVGTRCGRSNVMHREGKVVWYLRCHNLAVVSGYGVLSPVVQSPEHDKVMPDGILWLCKSLVLLI